MVKTISPLELANQPPAERALTNQLIKEGRIQVVSVNSPATSPGKEGKEKRPPKERTKEPLEGLVGKRCKITLLNGTTLEGDLEVVSKFEIVLTNEGWSLVVLKHAIATAEGAREVKP